MKHDVNNLFTFNDLSIDREKYKKIVKPIENTTWSVDNRGVVYTSRGTVAIHEPIWDGSPRVRINKKGCQRYQYVNDLVLRTFVGPPPSSRHVPWHCDGDRENCSLDNLSWQIVIRENVNDNSKTTEDGRTGSDQG